MKLLSLLSTPVLVALLGAGCHSKPAASAVSEGDTNTAALFEEGKGVWFTAATQPLLGVEVVEVVEKSMPQRVQRMAQVYRTANDAGTACALVRLATNEFTRLRSGQSVRLEAGSNGSVQFSGRLARLDSQTLLLFGEAEALVEFADSNRHCAVGDVLTAAFPGESKPALVVPASALLAAADGSCVYAVNGTHLTRVGVRTGESVHGYVAIEEGLYAGDSVAAKGIENLWLIELSALKGGTPCCPAPKKKADK